jgi:hypothetical protein
LRVFNKAFEGVIRHQTAESSRANAEARAEMFGVDTEPIKKEVNERSTLQKLFAFLNTGERTMAAFTKEAAKRQGDYRQESISRIEKSLVEEPAESKGGIFVNPETGRFDSTYFGSNLVDKIIGSGQYKGTYSEDEKAELALKLEELKAQYAAEGKDEPVGSMGKSVLDAFMNKEGEYQDVFWEDVLDQTHPEGDIKSAMLKGIEEREAKTDPSNYTNPDGTVDLMKYFEASKSAGTRGLGSPIMPEFQKNMVGTPNMMAGLYMGIALDPFPEAAMLIGSRTVARPLSKLWKTTGLGTKIAGTKLGKTSRMWGRALSFNKDPVTKLIQDEKAYLTQRGIEITDEIRPYTDQIAKGKQKYKVVADSIADYIDTPPWKVQDVYKDIKEIRVKKKKIMKIITETVGDTVEVGKLQGIEKKLDAIEDRLGKWYQKIEDSVKANSKTTITVGEYTGDSYEQILRKWVKGKGGILTEYDNILGKQKIAGEYLDIPKYLRKLKGVPADELAASLKVELPEVAGALKIDGDDALRQALKKKVKQLNIDTLTTEDYQDILADAVRADLDEQAGYIAKNGKPKEGSLTELVMTKEGLEEMRNLQAGKIDFDPLGTPIMDKGTGKEVSKKVYEDIMEEVTRMKKVKEVKKFRQGIENKKLQPIVDFLKGKLRKAGVEDLGEGYLKEDYIPYRANPDEIVYPTPGAKSPLDELSPAKPVFEHKRKFHTLLQRKKFGKISTNRDAFKLTFQRLMESEGAKARARIVSNIKDLADEFRSGKVTGEEIFVKYADDVPEADVGKWSRLKDPELKNFMMPNEYAEVMERQLQFSVMDKPMQWITSKFDKSMHIMKGYMTVANMGFHMRNFYSNFWHLYLKDGMLAFDPMQHSVADRIMFARFHPDEVITVGNKTMSAEKWLYAATDVRQGGIYNRGFIRADQAALLNQQLELMQMPRWKRIRTKFNPASREFFVLKTGDAVGGYIENHARLVGWLNDIEKGMDFKAAGKNTKYFMIDYGDLSTFEKNVPRRAFPFYSWLRKNSELEITQLFKQAKKFSLIPKLRNYVEALADDDLPEDEYVYEYLKDMYAVKMPFDVAGEDVYYNLDFPFQDLSMWANIPLAVTDPSRLKDFVSEFVSMGNPMLKVPAELAFNKELFFDREIRDKALTEAPPLAQMLNIGQEGAEGERYVSGTQDYLLRQIPFLSNLGKMNPLEEWEGGEKGRTEAKRTTDLLSSYFGLKFFPYDEEKGKISYERKLLAAINQEITNQNMLGADIPEQNKIASALKALYERQISEETGMDDIRSLEDMFKITGGKTEEMSLMLQLLKEPYQEKADKVSGQTLAELMEFFESEGYDFTEEQVREAIGQ